jgi:hypothetical protein
VPKELFEDTFGKEIRVYTDDCIAMKATWCPNDSKFYQSCTRSGGGGGLGRSGQRAAGMAMTAQNEGRSAKREAETISECAPAEIYTRNKEWR